MYSSPNLEISVKDDGSLKNGRDWHNGTPHKLTGYMNVMCTKTDRCYLVHRLIGHAFVHNPAPRVFKQIDHINHNNQDNRATNLRWVSAHLNNLNRNFKNCRKGKWGYKSVVTYNKQPYNLGWYEEADQATAVAQDFKQLLFHVAYLEYCKNAREIWQKSHRSYLRGRPADLTAAVERLDLGARRHRNLRKSLVLLLNSFREAPRVLQKFQTFITKEHE